MRATLRTGRNPAKIKLRMSVRSLPSGATVDATDLMFQPGRNSSGYLPHVTELPWSAGVSEENNMYPSTNLEGVNQRVSEVENSISSVESISESAQTAATSAQSDVDSLGSRVDLLYEFMSRVNEGTGSIGVTDNFDTDSVGGGGGVFIERRGPVVVLSIAAVGFGTDYRTHAQAIPEGFRPSAFTYELMSTDNGAHMRQVDALASGTVRTREGEGSLMRGTMVWATDQEWPDL